MSTPPTAGARVAEVLAEAVAAGAVPGAVGAAGIGRHRLGPWIAGWAQVRGGPARPLALDTRFDLASLTKVVVTLPLVLRLVDQGRVDLDEPVRARLPAFAGGDKDRVTLRHLLTHTAGLPGHRELYRWCPTPAELLEGIHGTDLVAPPGRSVCYSDLGFIVLGELVETVVGAPLDQVARGEVLGPLGMAGAGFRPEPPAEGVAATEVVGDGVAKVGVVHDENAEALGGVAGHAGAFATVEDLARYARWWVGDEEVPVGTAARRRAVTCHTDDLGGRRGLGWVCRGDDFDLLDDTWPATAVSHTGFTGTSLALDPDRGWWAVLLTNAVHLGRDGTGVRRLRRHFHAAVAEALAGHRLPAGDATSAPA